MHCKNIPYQYYHFLNLSAYLPQVPPVRAIGANKSFILHIGYAHVYVYLVYRLLIGLHGHAFSDLQLVLSGLCVPILFIHIFIYLSIHLFIRSFIHFIHSSIHSFPHLVTHSFTHLLVHLLIPLFIHSFIHLLAGTCKS